MAKFNLSNIVCIDNSVSIANAFSFEADKAVAQTSVSAFVLPSSFSKGLPMADLEAMSYCLPCLLSAACNLPEMISAGAAVPPSPSPQLWLLPWS